MPKHLDFISEWRDSHGTFNPGRCGTCFGIKELTMSAPEKTGTRKGLFIPLLPLKQPMAGEAGPFTYLVANLGGQAKRLEGITSHISNMCGDVSM